MPLEEISQAAWSLDAATYAPTIAVLTVVLGLIVLLSLAFPRAGPKCSNEALESAPIDVASSSDPRVVTELLSGAAEPSSDAAATQEGLLALLAHQEQFSSRGPSSHALSLREDEEEQEQDDEFHHDSTAFPRRGDVVDDDSGGSAARGDDITSPFDSAAATATSPPAGDEVSNCDNSNSDNNVSGDGGGALEGLERVIPRLRPRPPSATSAAAAAAAFTDPSVSPSSSAASSEIWHQAYQARPGSQGTALSQRDLDSAMHAPATFDGGGRSGDGGDGGGGGSSATATPWPVELATSPSATTSVAWGGGYALPQGWSSASRGGVGEAPFASCGDGGLSSYLVQSFPTDECPLSPASVADAAAAAVAAASHGGRMIRIGRGGFGGGATAAFAHRTSAEPSPPPPTPGEGSGGGSEASGRWKPPGLSYVPAVVAEGSALPLPLPPFFSRSGASCWAAEGAAAGGGRGANTTADDVAAGAEAGSSGMEAVAAEEQSRALCSLRHGGNLPQPLDTPLQWYRRRGVSGGGNGEKECTDTAAARGGVQMLSAELTGVVPPPEPHVTAAQQPVQVLLAATDDDRLRGCLPAPRPTQESVLLPNAPLMPPALPPPPPPPPSPPRASPPSAASMPYQHSTFLSHYSQLGVSGGGGSIISSPDDVQPMQSVPNTAAVGSAPAQAPPPLNVAARTSRTGAESVGGSGAATIPSLIPSGAMTLTPFMGPPETMSDPVCGHGGGGGGITAGVFVSSAPSEVSVHVTGTSLPLSDGSRADALSHAIFTSRSEARSSLTGGGAAAAACGTSSTRSSMSGGGGGGGGTSSARSSVSGGGSGGGGGAVNPRSSAVYSVVGFHEPRLSGGAMGAVHPVVEEQEMEGAAEASGSTVSLAGQCLEFSSTSTTGGDGGSGAIVLQLRASPPDADAALATAVTPSPFATRSAAQRSFDAPPQPAVHPSPQVPLPPPAAAASAARRPQLCINLGELLHPPQRPRDPASMPASTVPYAAGPGTCAAAPPAGPHAGGAGARGTASVLYTSRCSSQLLSIKLEGAAAAAAAPGSQPAAAAAAGAISRHVASTLMRHIPPGRLVRVSALAVRGCIQLLIRVQLGPPLQPAAAAGMRVRPSVGAAAAAQLTAAPNHVASGQAPAGPTEMPSPARGGSGGGGGGGFATLLPHGWREVTEATALAEPSAVITAAIPEPAVLGTPAPDAADDGGEDGDMVHVRLELLYNTAAAGGGDGGGGGEEGPAALRIVAAAEERVLLDEVYGMRGRRPYIDLTIPAWSLAGLPPGPLHLWLLRSPLDDPRVTEVTSPSLLAGSTELLLLPQQAAAELENHIRQILSEAAQHDPATTAVQPAGGGIVDTEGDAPAAAASRGVLTRGQVWSQHLQPLVADFGYVLAAAGELRAGSVAVAAATAATMAGGEMAAEAEAWWLDLATDLLGHCEAAGLAACGEVLQQAIADGGGDFGGGGGGDAADDDGAVGHTGVNAGFPWTGSPPSASSLVVASAVRPINGPGFLPTASADPDKGAAAATTHADTSVAAAEKAVTPPPALTPPSRRPSQATNRVTLPYTGGRLSPHGGSVDGDEDPLREGGEEDAAVNPYGSPFSTNNVYGSGDEEKWPEGYSRRVCTVLIRPLPPCRAWKTPASALLPRPYGSAAAGKAAAAGGCTDPQRACTKKAITAADMSPAVSPPPPLSLAPPPPPCPPRQPSEPATGSSSTAAAAAAAGAAMYGILPHSATSAAAVVSHCGSGSGSGRTQDRPCSDAMSAAFAGDTDVPSFTGCYLEPQQSGVHTGNTITDPLCATAGQMLSGVASTAAESDTAGFGFGGGGGGGGGGRRSLDGRVSGGGGGGVSSVPRRARATKSVQLPAGGGSYSILPTPIPLHMDGDKDREAAAEAAEAATSAGVTADAIAAAVGGGWLQRESLSTAGGHGAAATAAAAPAEAEAATAELPAGYEEVEVELLVASVNSLGRPQVARGASQGRTASPAAAGMDNLNNGTSAPSARRHHRSSSTATNGGGATATAPSPGHATAGSSTTAAPSANLSLLQLRELPPGPLEGLKTPTQPPGAAEADMDCLECDANREEGNPGAAVTTTREADGARVGGGGAGGGAGSNGGGRGAAERHPLQPRAAAVPTRRSSREGYGHGGNGGGARDGGGGNGNSDDDSDGLCCLRCLGYQEVECGLLLRGIDPTCGSVFAATAAATAAAAGGEDGGATTAAGREMELTRGQSAVTAASAAPASAAAATIAKREARVDVGCAGGNSARSPRDAAGAAGRLAPGADASSSQEPPPVLLAGQPGPGAQPPPSVLPPAPTAMAAGKRPLGMEAAVAAALALGYRDVTCTLLVKDDSATHGSSSSHGSSLGPGWLDMSSGEGTSESLDTQSGDDGRRRQQPYLEVRCGLLLRVLQRRRVAATEILPAAAAPSKNRFDASVGTEALKLRRGS
ncbi:hypothetical protein VOLCADRAFT_88062 [Volvox carteri f. nagariensis]|uniref:Uncharacterized protein n=1 Tax=Volvox carteri f. nagariensis TaxID=3068 RepID=D8TMZ0_VOLCA|nr:uncharacterized protein VOLCADRAFT_88062 [Volvox carteri f. nagariensis]EFJ51210.1 hypothetical protein VOLCADRAFT_88062 [Volvox carteri f. nagariensis]|eukprot:XP_002947677.1 hypothetical protein VOLCADRAFT_88062 [Volvox carteri f. nagariensis]